MVSSSVDRYRTSLCRPRKGVAAAMTLYSSCCSRAMTLFQTDESTNAPCTSTMTGLDTATADAFAADTLEVVAPMASKIVRNAESERCRRFEGFMRGSPKSAIAWWLHRATTVDP